MLLVRRDPGMALLHEDTKVFALDLKRHPSRVLDGVTVVAPNAPPFAEP